MDKKIKQFITTTKQSFRRESPKNNNNDSSISNASQQKQKKEQKRTLQKSTIMKQMQIYPSPSLIRRARVIRRRTTNIYCETLKRLREEDAALIDQILIIKLKPRSFATDFERSFVDNQAYEFIPSVDFAHPPMGSNAVKFPPPYFYPDFMRGIVQRKEQREAFQVVLTDQQATRTFAFCFKFQNRDVQFSTLVSSDSGISSLSETLQNMSYSVLVFVSQYPQERFFHELAIDFVNTYQREPDKLMPMCRDLLQLRLTTSVDFAKFSKYVVGNNGVVNGTNKYCRHWPQNSVSIVLEKVGIENALMVFLGLLAERRVIITGSNVTSVSEAVQAFVRLLAPLEWPHSLIPIVPDSQTQICHNPTPYIYGILRYNLSKISELICPQKCPIGDTTNEDITVIDVERGIIVPQLTRSDHRIGLKRMLNYAGEMGFPRGAVCDILSDLKGCLPVRDADKADYKIQKRVMIWYAKLFGHYRAFGTDILTARNRKLFAGAHPCPDTRIFLKWFVENGMLQTFISAQADGFNSTGVLRLRFQTILNKYAPPVTKVGKRRRTKSLIWKMFTH